MKGVSICLICALAALAGVGRVRAGEGPFRLPPGARVAETLGGGGWRARGTLELSFMQAQARLATAIAAAGWEHRHTIALGKNRTLDAWQRDTEELTVMIWRIAPGRSGFSYGFGGGASAGKDKDR